MASIVVDGPREWALDVLDRKLGRALCAVGGVGMLVAVYVIDPGPTRFACAVGAIVLLVRATAMPSAVTSADLAEVELLVMRHQDQYDAHIEAARADVIQRISEVRADVEVIVDQLAR